MTAIRTQISRSMFGNSIALLATAQITAGLGYVFWMVCAQKFPAAVIGVSNTVIAAMALVAMLTVSGFVPMLTRKLPGADIEERSGLCSTAFVLTITLSGAAGAASALFLPDRMHAAIGTGWLVFLISTGTMASSMVLVVGAALLGIRRAELSLFSDVAGSISRLCALATVVAAGLVVVGVVDAGARTILGIWVGSLMLSAGVAVFLLVRAQPGFRFRPHLKWLHRVRRSVGWDHLAMLAVRTPPFLIPILASAVFHAEELGYLAMTTMIASAFFAVGSAVSNALLADCADDPHRLQIQVRRAFRLISMLLLPPVVITCIFAREVLSFFGPGYAQHSPLLILLLLATLPDALTNVAVAILRVRRRLPIVAAITVTGSLLIVGGAWVAMQQFGVLGAGLAVLVAHTLIAIAFFVVGLRSFVKQGRTVEGSQLDASPHITPSAPAAVDTPGDSDAGVAR